ncbi:N-6 DNA methylase [Acinetobacter baumannii]
MSKHNTSPTLNKLFNSQIHTRKYSDILGRYYTPFHVADILCKSMGYFNKAKVVDLGCGTGNLINASLKYWNDCVYDAYDIDDNALSNIYNNNLKLTTFNLDVIHNLLPPNMYDLGISNPPYTYFSNKKISIAKYTNSKFEESIFQLNRIPAPLIFLNNLFHTVKRDGLIGIILPNGILVNKTYKKVRETLLNEYKILKIIQLESYVFEKTETQAHLLIIKNIKPRSKYVIQFLKLKSNELVEPYLLKNTSCTERLDYSFSINNMQNENEKLNQYVTKIFRGKKSSKDIKDFQSKTFHTTNFKKGEKYIDISYCVEKSTKGIYAQKGDILIARVGRCFNEKIAIVKSNYIEVSDSIIIIRPKNGKTNFIYKYLKSELGQKFLKNFSQGTGAKYITHEHILNLPVILG